jgi:proteasome lid subunit RPN8/RPN11
VRLSRRTPPLPTEEEAELDLPTPKAEIIISGWAYYKMRYYANKYEVEVGGWGVAPSAEEPLTVKDIALTKQESTPGSIDFDDEGVVQFMEDMCDLGYKFDQFMRVWVHTHPGNSATPSSTDRETYQDLATTLPFVVMLIIAREGEVSAELGYTCAGVFFSAKLPVKIDWTLDSWLEWNKEFHEHVEVPKPAPREVRGGFCGIPRWEKDPTTGEWTKVTAPGEKLWTPRTYDPDKREKDSQRNPTQPQKAKKKEKKSDDSSVVIPGNIYGELTKEELAELSRKMHESCKDVDYDALSEEDWVALVNAEQDT